MHRLSGVSCGQISFSGITVGDGTTTDFENQIQDNSEIMYIPCEDDNVHFDGWGG